MKEHPIKPAAQIFSSELSKDIQNYKSFDTKIQQMEGTYIQSCDSVTDTFFVKNVHCLLKDQTVSRRFQPTIKSSLLLFWKKFFLTQLRIKLAI